MNGTSPQEIELTPDLLDYAKAVAIKEATKCCPRHVDYDDVVQDALLNLIRKPPKHDSARGGSVKTLIYTIVQRAVLKYAAREVRHASRFKQPAEREGRANQPGDDAEPRTGTAAARGWMLDLMDAEARDEAPTGDDVGRRAAELTRSGWTTDDVIQFIDNEESRALCRLVLECDGNMSAAARRLGLSEGTVRHRLRMLAPKLRAAGFNPFSSGGGP